MVAKEVTRRAVAVPKTVGFSNVYRIVKCVIGKAAGNPAKNGN